MIPFFDLGFFIRLPVMIFVESLVIAYGCACFVLSLLNRGLFALCCSIHARQAGRRGAA